MQHIGINRWCSGLSRNTSARWGSSSCRPERSRARGQRTRGGEDSRISPPLGGYSTLRGILSVGGFTRFAFPLLAQLTKDAFGAEFRENLPPTFKESPTAMGFSIDNDEICRTTSGAVELRQQAKTSRKMLGRGAPKRHTHIIGRRHPIVREPPRLQETGGGWRPRLSCPRPSG
jgi:hypothetical protein